MKFFTLILFLFCTFPAHAIDRISALITITNAAGTTNGQTLTNVTVRTWTNSVASASDQILTNNSIGGAATNLYNQIAANPYPGPVYLTRSGTNGIILRGADGLAMPVSVSLGWATVTLSTQVVTLMTNVAVPASGMPTPNAATNIFSSLIESLDYSTSAVHQANTAFSTLLGTTNAQTITGAKTLTGANTLSNANNFYTGGGLSNLTARAIALQYFATNAGVPLYNSGGTLVGALVVDGNGALSYVAITALTDAITTAANPATLTDATVLNRKIADLRYGGLTNQNLWTATNVFTGHIGSGSAFLTNLIAYTKLSITNTGGNADLFLDSPGSSAIINYRKAGVTFWRAMLSSSTTNYQVRNDRLISVPFEIDTDDDRIDLRGPTYLSGLTTISDYANFTAPVDITNLVGTAYVRFNSTALANGVNAAIDISTNTFVKIFSGPSGAFTIAGIAGGYDGRRLILYNSMALAMTVANDSGGDPTSSNRIYTMTGADVTTTGIGTAELLYDGQASRWILLYCSP